MRIDIFRGDEFINREKEIEYLKKRFLQTPKEILWIYGPKSTGKTTLIEYVIEKELTHNLKIFDKYWIKYINFRRTMVGSYDSFINSFFEKAKKDDFTNEVKAEFDIGIFKLEAKVLEEIRKKDKNLFHELIEKLKKVKKIKIIVIDEIQALEDIYYNGEKELLKEFLNFCVSLTKELHLAHVIILSSNTVFIERIYNDAKLKVTSDFMKIDHLDKKTTKEWLKTKEFSDEEIELIWDYLGGCIPLIQRMVRKKEYFNNLKEYLENEAFLAKNEVADLISRYLDDREYDVFLEIIKKIVSDKFILPDRIDKETLKVIEFISEKEIFFYDPLTREVKGNNRLYEKAFEILIKGN